MVRSPKNRKEQKSLEIIIKQTRTHEDVQRIPTGVGSVVVAHTQYLLHLNFSNICMPSKDQLTLDGVEIFGKFKLPVGCVCGPTLQYREVGSRLQRTQYIASFMRISVVFDSFRLFGERTTVIICWYLFVG